MKIDFGKLIEDEVQQKTRNLMTSGFDISLYCYSKKRQNGEASLLKVVFLLEMFDEI